MSTGFNSQSQPIPAKAIVVDPKLTRSSSFGSVEVESWTSRQIDMFCKLCCVYGKQWHLIIQDVRFQDEFLLHCEVEDLEIMWSKLPLHSQKICEILVMRAL
jgi:hypothetical protein